MATPFGPSILMVYLGPNLFVIFFDRLIAIYEKYLAEFGFKRMKNKEVCHRLK